MPRYARIVLPGIPYHITQRGNRHAEVFFQDRDRVVYLQWLKDYCDKEGVKIWAYCLMTNHVHLIAVPSSKESLSKVLASLHTRYVVYVNNVYKFNGHLWQNRFYSCPMDKEHLCAAVRYVENNPVRAKMVRKAEDYQWSSASAHVRNSKDPLLANDLPLLKQISNWSDWLQEGNAERELQIVRKCTRSGFPLGNVAFIREVERKIGRKLLRDEEFKGQTPSGVSPCPRT